MIMPGPGKGMIMVNDKDKTYIVHCARGGRSARAAAKMKSNFANLYDFSGGMTAWQKAGKPVEKTPEK